MKKLIGLLVILSMAGCAICKSSDTPEQCRTKQRDHSQKSSIFGAAVLDVPAAPPSVNTG